MRSKQRRAIIQGAASVIATLLLSDSLLAGEGFAKLKLDVVGQFVDLLSGLLKLVEDTVSFYQSQKDRNARALKINNVEQLAKSLTSLSWAIQNSLYNGSNPALQQFQAYLEGPPPYDLGVFGDTIKDLSAMTASTVSTLSASPSELVLNTSYGQLLSVQHKRLALFEKLGRLKGNATPAQVKQMRRALQQWEQLNASLEAAITQLNGFVQELSGGKAKASSE